MKMDGREEERVKERKKERREREEGTRRGENRKKKRGWRGVGVTVLPRGCYTQLSQHS